MHVSAKTDWPPCPLLKNAKNTFLLHALCCTFESICSYNFRLKNVGQMTRCCLPLASKTRCCAVFFVDLLFRSYFLVARVNKSLPQASTVQRVFDSFSIFFSAAMPKLPCNLLTEWVTVLSRLYSPTQQRSPTESSIARSPMLKSLMPSPS